MSTPILWHEPAPRHFDLAVPWWLKMLAVAAATAVAFFFLDQPIAAWAKANAERIPDLMRLKSDGRTYSDLGRELMFLEQCGQFACSVVVILAVAMLDRAGRRRALSLAIGCLVTLALTYLLKDLLGRSRPFVASKDGAWWVWLGPWQSSSSWTSFPSAHTTAAFTLATGLSWFYPRGRALFMGLALITATQRVLHTAHYVSDVCAGMGIGVFVARVTLHAKLAGRLIALAPAGARAWWMRDAE